MMEKRIRKYSYSSSEEIKQQQKTRSARRSERQNSDNLGVKKERKKRLTSEERTCSRDRSISPDERRQHAYKDKRGKEKEQRKRAREQRSAPISQKELHYEQEKTRRSPSGSRKVRTTDTVQQVMSSPRARAGYSSPDRHERSRSASQDIPNYRKREYRSPIQRGNEHPRYWDSSKKGEDDIDRKRRRGEDDNLSYELGERYYGEVKSEKSSNIVPRKAKVTDMLNTRTGGAYIPPAKLKMMQAEITDKTSAAYQRIAWEALKKSIHGHINKINIGNIGIIIKELLRENIIRGRGLLCRSIIQAQAASPTFTHVYAALVSAINSRFPNIGELLLKRLVIQFKRGFKRNDKSICISAATFVAHLVNQKVTHEILALELLTLLVESPTDDSVEVAIAFLKECGQKLTEVSAKGINAIFEMLRNILHEGHLDKRVQYMIEVMFQIRKDGFKDHVAVIEELELVQEEDQFTHLMMLDEATDPQDILNVFKLDDKYEENEEKYKTLSKEILGSDAESGSEDGSGESGSEDESEEEPETAAGAGNIIDNTETNLIALRRTIYLTINSSLDFEECAHKLMKMQLKPGQEMELCHMFLDCCAEQRTYEKFYGLLAQRFCQINKIYIGPFEEIFNDSYSTAHRLDTNRLRNVSKFFAHLFFTDSIGWEALECVKLNEEDTTSSSRIYIKIMFQELAEYMGLKKLNDRLKDMTLQGSFAGIFPRDNPKNTRFAINFFTSIGLGGLTDELREHLKQIPKVAPAEQLLVPAPDSSSSSSSEDSSSSSSSDSSSSSEDSSSDEEDRRHSKNKSLSRKKKKDHKEKENMSSHKSENRHKQKKAELDVRPDLDFCLEQDDRAVHNDRDIRQCRDKVDRPHRDNVDRRNQDKVDRYDKDIGDRHNRNKVDRHNRDKNDGHDQDKIDRHDRDKGDRRDRDKGDRHDRDKSDRHDRDKGDRHDRNKGDRHDRDKGDRHDQDKGDRHDRNKEERRNRDKKKR